MLTEEQLTQKVTAKLKASPEYADQLERQSAEEPDKLTDQELQERAEFHAKWLKMNELGESMGWLTYD